MSHETHIPIKDKSPLPIKFAIRRAVAVFALTAAGLAVASPDGRGKLSDGTKSVVNAIGSIVPNQTESLETQTIKANMLQRQQEPKNFDAGEAINATQTETIQQIDSGAVNYDPNTGGPVNP